MNETVRFKDTLAIHVLAEPQPDSDVYANNLLENPPPEMLYGKELPQGPTIFPSYT